MESLEKIIVKLLTTDGIFYASLLSQMVRTATEEIPTAGVTIRNGRIEMYWNPKFFESLSMTEATAVLEHECLHLVMDHIVRKVDRDHQTWNIATDLAINQLIKGLPKDAITLNKFPKDWKLQPNQSAEEYYDIIYKNSPKMEITDDGKGNMHVKVTDGKGNVTGEFDLNGPGNHDKWDEADSPDIAKEVLKQAVQQAKDQTERGQGHLPHGIEEHIKELLKPPVVPWQHILRKFVAMSIKAGHKMSWKRPNRRYGSVQKGKLPARKIAITIAIDTSGSINENDFNEFIAEIKSIQQCYKSDVTVIECDADVQKEYKLTPFNKVDTDFKGRGGTSFIPVFDYVKKKSIKTDVLIYFTDLCGDFPDKAPHYPTLWVSTSSYEEAPFGMVLPIRKHEEKERW